MPVKHICTENHFFFFFKATKSLWINIQETIPSFPAAGHVLSLPSGDQKSMPKQALLKSVSVELPCLAHQ